MAEITEKIVFDDSAVIEGLSRLDKQMDDLNDKIRETEMSYEEAFAIAEKAMDESSKATEEATKSVNAHMTAQAKATQESAKWNTVLKDQIRDIRIFGTSLGSVVDGLKQKAVAMRAVTASVGGGTKALKLFRLALISTGIGAIVVALGSMVALLSKSQKGIDAVNVVLKSVGAVIQVFVDRAIAFGGALVKLFKGDVTGAFTDAKKAISGVGEEIKKEIAQAAALERRHQALRDSNRELTVEYANRRAEIAKLRLVIEDTTKSEEERILAAQEAAKIETELLDKRKAAAAEELAIIQERNAMGESLVEDLDKERDARVALSDIELESFNLQRELQSKLNSIQEQAAAKRAAEYQARREQIAKINEELQKQVDLIEQAYQEVQLNNLSPEERLQAEAQLARDIVDEQFRKLEELAKAAGKEIDLTKEKAAIQLQIEKNLVEDIKKLREENSREVAKLKTEEDKLALNRQDAFMAEMVSITKDYKDPATEELLSPIEKLESKLADLVGLDVTTFREVVGQIAGSLGEIFSGITAGTDRAIEANDRLLASIQQRTATLQEELEEELALQEKGLANSVSGKQEELQKLLQEEQKAQKEREKLEKAKLRQKLLQDGVTQASNLVTMGSNVIAAESGKGLLGVGFALAAIAAFVGIFNQIKNAQKGATDVKLSGGGDIASSGASGFVNKSGRTDKYGSRGHRVEDSNLVLGGKEFVVSEGPAHVHAEFLRKLNEGKYNDLDLIRELQGIDGVSFADENVKRFERRNRVIASLKDANDKAFQVRAMDAIFGRHIGELNKTVKKSGKQGVYVVPKGGGTVVRTDEHGNKTTIEVN